MSIWYHYDVTAMGNRDAIGKFFNLDPEGDIHHIDTFDFSFGQKNIPGLRLGKVIEQNPGLIFLINQTTDFDDTWWLQRYDTHHNKMQNIFVMQIGHEWGSNSRKFNKVLWEEYKKKFPKLMEQHEPVEGSPYEGRRPYDWKWFFNDFDVVAFMLSKADQYKDTVTVPNQPMEDYDPSVEFDALDPVE